ncbi:MAG: hypothetical protein AB8H03_10280 [Saprospiraceae bacterium]
MFSPSKKYNAIIILLLCLLSNLSFSQLDSSLKNRIGFSTQLLLSSPIKIKRNYTSNQTDITSGFSPAVQATITYNRKINNRFWGNIGLNIGSYSFNKKVYVSNAYNEMNGRDYSSNNPHFGYTFLGLKLGGGYNLINKEKFQIMIGLDIIGSYFFSTIETEFVNFIPTNNAIKKIYTFDVKGNKDELMIFSSELSANFYKRLKYNLLFNLGLSFTYSQKETFEGNYIIYGDNQNLTGSFNKTFRHSSFSVGLFYQF